MPLRDDNNLPPDDAGFAKDMPETDVAAARQAPIINAPTVVIVLAGAMLAGQVVRMASPDAWQSLMNLAVVASGAVGFGMGDRPLGDVGPLLLHPFLHTGWMNAALSIAAVLTFGGVAARPFGNTLAGSLQFIGFFFFCAIVGAIAEIIIAGERGTMMLGDWTAISGCIAGAGWAMGGVRGLLRFSIPWGAIQIVFLLLSFTGFVEGGVGEIVSLATGALVYPLAIRLAKTP